jgi:phosphoserine aminotransferase
MKRYIILLALIATNVFAQDTATINLDAIQLGVIGDNNQNHVVIGANKSKSIKKHTLTCKNIKQIIIGKNSAIQLLLPDDSSSLCQEKH